MEARLESGEPAGEGWFVLNLEDARWERRPGRGLSVNLTGLDPEVVERLFPMLGINLRVAGPGEPITVYHHEPEQEAFLVLDGEGLLLVEGEERPLRRWDFVHCPPGTEHAIVGGPITVLAIGTRATQATADPHTIYVDDEVARRHGAAPPETTTDAGVAYAHFPPGEVIPFQRGWLPG